MASFTLPWAGGRLPSPSRCADISLPTPTLTPAPGHTTEAHYGCQSVRIRASTFFSFIPGLKGGSSEALVEATAPQQSLLHQEVDEGGSGGQEGLLDASPLQEPDA